jgi:hypothetical protein
MNPASVILWSNEINWKIILTYYLTGFPFDLVQAAGTALFLWLFSRPMLEKLDRVKVKYGLMEEPAAASVPPAAGHAKRQGAPEERHRGAQNGT